MPAAVPVTYADFKVLESRLTSMGFVEIPRSEIATIIVAHGLEPPRRMILPGEIGFKYFENGYVIKVWTSCVREMVERCRATPLLSSHEVVSRPSHEDLGWVVVVDSRNRAQYFARPSLRTKNFTQALSRRAWITWWKVRHRPLCEGCKKFMVIFEKKDGGTFWACFHKNLHGDTKPLWKDWDFRLPPRALTITRAWRREFYRYLKRERANGNEPQRARSIRKAWIAKKNPY